jgi:hypothetical protein
MNYTTIGNDLLDLTYVFENIKQDFEKFIKLSENILHKKNVVINYILYSLYII